MHLHLEHPLVMRLLDRFLMRGFHSDALSRAVVLARLSLHGHGATRLHHEVLAMVTEWDPADPNRRLRKLSVEKSDRAIKELQASLQQHLAADVSQLREALDRVVEERLQTIDSDLEREPERIRRTFALQTHGVGPAGAMDP
ncbi:MAG: hypothetical protein ER33_07315 [Cyanobium sp. CACIAM 14]|nr:MAG: hypothetical protein ER33_07315 [Cyanobium sp. CACIAM 14]